jgi:GntR family transcriptional regulator
MAVKHEYFRVKMKLLEDIRKGVYTIGAKLPTERDMCDMFGVSRITIRKALSELELEGWVERVQGKGTFIQEPKKNPSKFESMLSSNYSFSEELRRQNVTPSTRVLSLTTIPAQPPLTHKLQVAPGHMVDVVLRLRLADEIPYAYETSYVPSEYLNGATADEIARDGLYNTMDRKSGIRPNKAEEVLEAAIAPEMVAEALGRKGLLSVMQIERTAFVDEQIVEYCTSSVTGDKYRFKVKLEG